MLENLLENKGVQMMLTNLIKAAAPQLVENIDQIGKIVQEFNERAKRTEALLEFIARKVYGYGSEPNDTGQRVQSDVPGGSTVASGAASSPIPELPAANGKA